MSKNEKAEGVVPVFKLIGYGLLIVGLVFGLTGSASAQWTTTPITSNTYDDLYPQIHNGIITWSGSDGSDYEIFMYDVASGTTTPITSNAYDDFYPQIHNGIITWYGYEGGSDSEIFMYNVVSGTTTQITSNANDDWSPEIDNGIITWHGNEGGSDYEIFMYSRQMQVPALTSIGLIALVGLLSAIATVKIVRKRR